MKLNLNKKKLKNLSKDNKALPAALTPKIAGGTDSPTADCNAGSMPPRCRYEN
mgnify:CR=1 FL=1